MNGDQLRSILNGEIDIGPFLRDIREEVEEWIAKLKKRGASAPITLTTPSAPITMTRESTARLLDFAQSGKLDLWSFCYIIDALLLSVHVVWQSARARECLEELSSSADAEDLSGAAIGSARDNLDV